MGFLGMKASLKPRPRSCPINSPSVSCYTHTHTHIHTNWDTNMYTRTHTHTQTHTHTNQTQIHKPTTHKHTNTQTRTNTQTQTHTHTHTHTHTDKANTPCVPSYLPCASICKSAHKILGILAAAQATIKPTAYDWKIMIHASVRLLQWAIFMEVSMNPNLDHGKKHENSQTFHEMIDPFPTKDQASIHGSIITRATTSMMYAHMLDLLWGKA